MQKSIGKWFGPQFELNMDPPEEPDDFCPHCGAEVEVNDDRINMWLTYQCVECGWHLEIDSRDEDIED